MLWLQRMYGSVQQRLGRPPAGGNLRAEGGGGGEEMIMMQKREKGEKERKGKKRIEIVIRTDRQAEFINSQLAVL
eukprot:scaffold13098_cov57-Skeletonema_menzelii.AAC.1